MKKVLAVDGNSILNRAYYGIRPLSNSKGVPTNALTGFVNILLKHLESIKPDVLLIAFDRKAPTFRHLMYDGYKSNRKGMPEELAIQLPYAKEIAKHMGFAVLEKDGIEADDILGTASLRCKESGNFCYILTGDRDSLQLIDDSYSAVLLAGNTDTVYYDEAKFKEKYQTTPKGLIDIKALMGDSSDCIPGVPGIGEKTAIALISQYSDIDKIYADTENLPLGKSQKEKIINGKEFAYLSKKLAEIKCDDDIEISLESTDLSGIDDLRKLLGELEMFSALNRINSSSYYSENTEAVLEESVQIQVIEGIEAEADGDLYCSFDFENSTVYIGKENNCIKLKVNDLCNFITVNAGRIVTYNSKAVYKYLFENGVNDFSLLKGDIMLAGYVVNSGMQKYSFERILLQYLHIAVEECSLSEIAYYSAKLMPILNEKLSESSQDKLYSDIELPLAKVIADMEYSGFYVDKNGLEDFGKELNGEIAEIEQQIYFMSGEIFNINSPKQLGTVLFEKMSLPAKKKTKSGYSTDADTLESLSPYHPIIDLILEYRTLSKLKSTFVDGMIKVISDTDGRIHTSFNQAVTATGRLSSAEPNLQNIPVRQKRGRELRKFFRAKSGYKLIDADYSQIELRLLAEISDDKDFKDAFISGEDIHRMTASQVFGMPYELVSNELRTRAKAVNFGIIYGISAFSLSRDIGSTVSEAKRYIESYLGRYTGVSDYLKNIVKFAHENGFVKTEFGRRRYIPELKSSRKTEQSFGERVAMNSPIQGTAADIIKLAMVNVYNSLAKSYPEAKLILQVHDELIIEAPENVAEKVADLLKFEMENVYKSDVPLTVEVNIGDTWFETK